MISKESPTVYVFKLISTVFNNPQLKTCRSGNITSKMKVLVLPTFFVLLIFLGASEGCTVQCPEGSNDDIDYLPSPTDCSKYYVCVHSQPIEMSCPEGLWWDNELNVCNFPENVTCDNSKYFLLYVFQMFTLTNIM